MSTTFESDWENTRLKEQLAAEQAHSAKLREALLIEAMHCRRSG